MPTVSVIVPLFNGIPHLDAFFESLAAALPDRAQVIVVDDGSTSRCWTSCRRSLTPMR